MKTKSKKLRFEIELHETEDCLWILGLRGFRDEERLDYTVLDHGRPHELERLRDKAKSLAVTVGDAPIEELTYEEVRDAEIAWLERRAVRARGFVESGLDIAYWSAVLSGTPLKIAQLRAWMRPLPAVAA